MRSQRNNSACARPVSSPGDLHRRRFGMQGAIQYSRRFARCDRCGTNRRPPRSWRRAHEHSSEREMKLADALKTSLDELRMQMLGLQVLFGFQFQGIFQDHFEAVDAFGRATDAAGLGFTIIALAIMLAICCQHRLVEGGEDSPRLFYASKRYANAALLPLAASIGCNLFVASEVPFGASAAAILAFLLFAVAILGWYVFGIILRWRWQIDSDEAPMQSATPLHSKIEQMLTECRIILPGAQALLGFQFVVMLTKAFGELPPSVQHVHLIALISLALSIVALLAPAAIHRLTYAGKDDSR